MRKKIIIKIFLFTVLCFCLQNLTIYAEESQQEVDVVLESKDTGNVLEKNEVYEEIKNGFITEDGNTYFYIDGEKSKGWVELESKWYFFDIESGRMRTGWLYRGTNTYYLNSEGVMLTGWQKIEGAKYYFQEQGQMLKGWLQEAEGVWRFFDMENGKMRTGWLYRGTNTYYLNSEGIMLTGWQEIEGAKYYFQEQGQMLKGWLQEAGGVWYFFDIQTGIMRTGWIKNDGKWYLLNNDGTMFTGWYLDNEGYWYFLRDTGSMVKGWLYRGSNTYFMDNSGRMTYNWQKISNVWYFFGNNGLMQSNKWLEWNNKWYYLTHNGMMKTGWLKYNGYWYYLQDSGSMVMGWVHVNGYWYYLYQKNDSNGGPYGTMAYSKVVEGRYLDESGRWITWDRVDMNNKADGYSSSTPYLILVNKDTNKVGIYLGGQGNWKNVWYWDCSDGAPATPTVSGVFHVGIKGYYFDSGAARCYWYTQFYGNYLFHSVLYNKNGTLMDGRLGMSLSHGCVRLQIDNAKWIYDSIPMGTTVVVY